MNEKIVMTMLYNKWLFAAFCLRLGVLTSAKFELHGISRYSLQHLFFLSQKSFQDLKLPYF